MLTLYPAAHEIPANFTPNGDGWLVPAGDSAITLDPLPNYDTWELTITLTSSAQANSETRVIVQHQIWNIDQHIKGEHSFTLNPRKSIDIAFYDFPDAPITLSISMTSRSYLSEGSQRVSLYAYLPRPEYSNALIGSCIIGAFTLPDSEREDDWTILGQSRLGYCFLSNTQNFYAWQNVGENMLSLDSVRGMSTTALTSKADIGTLTAAFLSDNDPRSSSLRRGTPIFVSETLTRARLFTGSLESISSTPDKKSGYTVTITAYDKVNELANINVYQRTENLPAYWQAAFAQLLESQPYRLVGKAGGPHIGKLVKEASLADYLDIYAATCKASWHIDTTNTIVISAIDRTSLESVYSLAIQTSVEPHGSSLDPVDVAAELNTASICTSLEITNNTAIYDSEKNEWTGETASTTVTNTTLAEAYGNHSEQLETCGDIDQIKAFYAGEIAIYDPWQIINHAEFNIYDWGNYIDDTRQQTLLAQIDIGDIAEVSYRNSEPRLERITRIEHHLSPLSWTVSIDLQPA